MDGPSANDLGALIGRTVAGKFDVLSLVGAGGMGAVFRARHRDLGTTVALKVLLGQDAECILRFEREAESLARIDHRCIVRVLDFGRDSTGFPYLAMEHVDGVDLRALVESQGALPLERVVAIGADILAGLAAVHDVGVVHRDLKPGNIVLCERADGTLLVKVLDFGISKMLNEEHEAKADPMAGKLTRVGSVVGTPQYMSPEQAQGLASVDHRTDLWSLGAIVYEMLAGQPAYDLLSSYEQTIVHIVVNPPPPLHVRAPWVPHGLSQVVHECLEHAIPARVRDAATFLRRLREVSAMAIRDVSGALPISEGSNHSLGSPSRMEMASREVPSALGSGPTTLNFDLGSQPNIPLAAYGVQVGARSLQASSNAPVALEQTQPSLTEDRMPAMVAFDVPAPRRASPLSFLLGALAALGLVVGVLALRGQNDPPPRAQAVALPKAPVRDPLPIVDEQAEPAAVDAGAPTTLPSQGKRSPQALVAPPPSAPSAPAWQPPPPKANRDRKLGDVGHTDEF